MSQPPFQVLAPVSEDDLVPIIKEMERLPIPMNHHRKTSGSGRTGAFGMTNKRCLPPDLSRLCWQRPYLYHLLLEFGRRCVPISWNAITINQDYAAAPHKDKGNKGLSYLVAFGEFQGGELQICDHPDLSGTYNIRNQPVLFDGANLQHAVRPFTGHRYSLVYYTLAKDPASSLEQYEPVQLPSGWVLEFTDKEGKSRILKKKDGLPHPLKGRRKAAV